MKKLLFILVTTLCATLFNQLGYASNLAYDEAANSAVDIQKALIKANDEKKNVLLIFGANWCKDAWN